MTVVNSIYVENDVIILFRSGFLYLTVLVGTPNDIEKYNETWLTSLKNC